MAKVTILLAAYNGSRYLEEQIKSILAQRYSDWVLTVSDDGSSDQTVDIIDAFAAQYPDKIIRHQSGRRFGSACAHFMYLLSLCDSEYVMFCDQDDVWLPEKIGITMEKMQSMESDGNRPRMVFSDMRVVNESLEMINPSFLHYSGLQGRSVAFNKLIIQNVVSGCTMMINRSLQRFALGADTQGALMHDWWLAMIASANGEISCIQQATMLYRQHNGNSVGAKRVYGLENIRKRLSAHNGKESLFATMRQAGAFAAAYGDRLTPYSRDLANGYAALPGSKKVSRLAFYASHGVWKQGILRKLAQILVG